MCSQTKPTSVKIRLVNALQDYLKQSSIQPNVVRICQLTPVLSVDETKKMKELLDCGTITQEEFNAFKKKTLGI